MGLKGELLLQGAERERETERMDTPTEIYSSLLELLPMNCNDSNDHYKAYH